jgi:exodeoxyribonuclease V beta subunit
VDWKTNWLGPDLTSYNQEQMHHAMREHDYYLQASLYREALMRYLALVDPRPFDEIYGGMYYLFLRGINSGSDSGVLLIN